MVSRTHDAENISGNFPQPLIDQVRHPQKDFFPTFRRFDRAEVFLQVSLEGYRTSRSNEVGGGWGFIF